MSQIHFLNDDDSFVWNDSVELSKWLLDICVAENLSLKELSYVYCSDSRLLEINKKYLSHDYFTDIVTFDLSEDASIEGEIYISIDRVKENAKTYDTSPEIELCRVHVHGLLHLIGFDDHTDSDRELMRNKENSYLSLLPKVPRGTF